MIINGTRYGDHLSGGVGEVDEIYGGAGRDSLRAAGDFDRLYLRSSIFTEVSALSGHLRPDMFVAGTEAADAGDRIIYDQASGNLWYDADGTGGEAPVLFAILSSHPALSAASFDIV